MINGLSIWAPLGSKSHNIKNKDTNQKPIHIRFNPKNFEIILKLIFVLVVLAQIIPFKMLAINIITIKSSINENTRR